MSVVSVMSVPPVLSVVLVVSVPSDLPVVPAVSVPLVLPVVPAVSVLPALLDCSLTSVSHIFSYYRRDTETLLL